MKGGAPFTEGGQAGGGGRVQQSFLNRSRVRHLWVISRGWESKGSCLGKGGYVGVLGTWG